MTLFIHSFSNDIVYRSTVTLIVMVTDQLVTPKSYSTMPEFRSYN